MPLSSAAATSSEADALGHEGDEIGWSDAYSAYAPSGVRGHDPIADGNAATPSPTAATVPQTSVPSTNGTSRG